MALNINGTTGISGVDGSASVPALQGTDSNTGINFGTDTVNINTGGIARATVDSNGRLGVGLTSPASPLHLHESSSGSIEGLKVTNSTTGTGLTDGLSIGLQSDEDVFIHNYQNTAIHFGTNDTTRLSILAGGGLTFNGDTAAANALDDYEEGTWTVGVDARAVTGSEGHYTKIGRFVVCQFALNGLNAQTTGANISGLPFTSKNSNQIGLCIIGDVSGVSFDSGSSDIYGRVNASVTNVQLLSKTTNGASHSSTTFTLNTNVVLRGYILYITD
tara:strand:- start:81 stop:902 length:822 start_codon:yes stop_codon:yes gene_type:complete